MKEKRILYIVYLSNLLLGLGLYSAIEVPFLQSKGISLVYISALNLSIPLISACLEIPTGILGDWIGRKRILHLTYISFSVSTLILILSNNIFTIFIAYFLEALGWSFYSGNTESIVYEISVKKKQDPNKSLGNFYSSLSIGYLLSGIVITFIPSDYNSEILFYALIITLVFRIISVIIVYFIGKGDVEDNLSKTPIKLLKKTAKLVFSGKQNISIAIYEALGRLQFYLPIIYQPILISNGFSVKQLGIIYAFTQLLQTISQKIAPNFVGKFGKKRIIKIGPVIQGISILLIASKNIIIIILGIAINFIIMPIKGQGISLLKHEEVDNEIRSTYLSIISLITLTLNYVFFTVCATIIDKNLLIGLTFLSIILMVLSLMVADNILSSNYEEVEG